MSESFVMRENVRQKMQNWGWKTFILGNFGGKIETLSILS